MPAALKILIVDDETPARKRLINLILEGLPSADVTEVSTGTQALEVIRCSRYDLIFLDVQMPGLTGIQIVQEIGAASMPLTIFVTAYDRHAIDAFEANALDYLLKPYSDERFEAALEGARNHLRRSELSNFGERRLQMTAGKTSRPHFLDLLAVKESNRTHLIPTSAIESIEGAGVYVTVHAHKKEYLYRGTLNQLTRDLNPDHFVRVHRSTIVNIAAIVLLEPTSHGEFEATLKGGRNVQISRTYRHHLEDKLQQKL